MNKFVRVKDGFDFRRGLEQSRQRLEYYQEGLFLDVSARIIGEMERSDVSRSELARRMEVSPAYVTKILRGHANLSLESLAKLAFALDLKWECILLPKDSSVGVYSLTDGMGQSAIRAVETMTVETLDTTVDTDPNAYSEGRRYELPIPA